MTVEGLDGSKIYMSPCGLGLGHIGRLHPIADELRRRGADVVFSTYLEGYDYALKHGFPVARSPHLHMSTVNGKIDLKITSVTQGLPALPRFARQTNIEMEYIKDYGPDVVVSDSRLSSIFAAKMLRIPTALILNQFQPIVPRSRHNFRLSKIADGVLLTLIGRGWATSDVIMIPDFPEPYTISIESLRIPQPYRPLIRLVGSIIPRQPSEIRGRDEIREEIGIDDGQKLILAAISGPEQERLPLIGDLKHIFEGFPDDYRIIMSMGYPNGGSEQYSSGPLTTVNWIPDRLEHLKACDLVVSRAGHETIMQSICFNKPQILIPTPGHTEQYANARRVKELGVGEAIHQRDLNTKDLLAMANQVSNSGDIEKKLFELISNNSIGDGVSNAVEVIESLIKK